MNQFILKMSVYRFLDAVKFIGVIFVLLFANNGMNPFQISILISIWSATQLLLEVPLGFVFYAIGFILWGFKNALTSGTLEAFVYDELKSLDKEASYEEVNGKLESAFWIGITVSAVLGGLIATVSYSLVLILSIITTVFAIIALLTIKSVIPIQTTGETKYLAVLKEAVFEIKNNSTLIGIIAFFCLIFATYGAADEYWPLIYQALGLPLSVIGIFVALGYGSFVVAGWTLKFFNNAYIKGKEHLLIILSAIKSDQRATISSFKSLVFEIVYMGFVLMFGFTSEKLGITSVMCLLGSLLVVWLLVFKVFLLNILKKILIVKEN